MGINKVHWYSIGDSLIINPVGYPYYIVGEVAEKVFDINGDAGYYIVFLPPYHNFNGYYHQNRCAYHIKKEKEETE